MQTQMRNFAILAVVWLIACPLNGHAQETKTSVDWDQAYKKLLAKDSGLKQKIENGSTTKDEVIAWMKNEKGNAGGKAAATQSKPGLKTLNAKLDAMVKEGTLTKEQAAKLLQTMADDGKSAKNNTPKDLAVYGAELKEAVEAGKMTKQEAIQAYREAAGGQDAKKKAKPAKQKRSKAGARPGSINFYAVVIGRLKSKDIELGELELDVDYVISENASINKQLLGKRVKLVGVSGAFLDNLLQIKRGETLKVRTGDYTADKNLLGFGYKFQVLERTAPFKPEDFGVPTSEFRGFRGELVGKVVEADGYVVCLQASEVNPAENSQAADAKSILGKRIRIAGFYDDHADSFADLHEGDVIRVSAVHQNKSSDSLNVTDVLEKVKE